MPASIVLVHTSEELLRRSAALLRDAGYEVATFTEPVSAYGALKVGQQLRVLATRVIYPSGQPNGIALARMALRHRPSVKVIFTVMPQFRDRVDFGRTLLWPVTPEHLSDAVASEMRAAHPVEPPPLNAI